MKFIKMFKQVVATAYMDSLLGNGIILGAGILGTIIMFIIINVTGGTQEYGTLGAILSLMIGILFYLLTGIFGLSATFNSAILMGRTRKYYLLAQMCVNIINSIIFTGIVFLISCTEKALYGILFDKYQFPINLDALFNNPVLLIGLVLLFPVVNMTLGTFYLKFSTKFVWGFWAIWMVACLGLPKIGKAAMNNPDSFLGKSSVCIMEAINKLTTFSIGSISIVMISVTALLGIIIFLMLRKQRALD